MRLIHECCLVDLDCEVQHCHGACQRSGCSSGRPAGEPASSCCSTLVDALEILGHDLLQTLRIEEAASEFF